MSLYLYSAHGDLYSAYTRTMSTDGGPPVSTTDHIQTAVYCVWWECCIYVPATCL